MARELPQEAFGLGGARDHLRQVKHGSVEEDFERNYSEDVFSRGREVYRGRDTLGTSRVLREELPDGAFEYRTRLVKGSMAFPRWKAWSESAKAEEGAGSFFIGDESIVAQTIRYTVEALGGEREEAGER